MELPRTESSTENRLLAHVGRKGNKWGSGQSMNVGGELIAPHSRVYSLTIFSARGKSKPRKHHHTARDKSP